MTCVFCAILDDQEPGDVLQVWPEAIALRPLNPITPDHVLIVPRRHLADATTDPTATATVARRAAQRARQGQHITVNVGAGAGQTVFHLHLHVFSCRGLDRCMPWGCPAETPSSTSTTSNSLSPNTTSRPRPTARGGILNMTEEELYD